MSADGVVPAAAAFDRLSSGYDELATGDAFLRQRRRTHAAFSHWLPPGCRVLEIGCGTGLDTELLAQSGRHVVACDPSAQMRHRTLSRIAAAGVSGHLRMLDCGLETLPAFLEAMADAEFDAIVSNFGALNCVRDLSPLGVIARRHLRPGGAALLCVMGRHCAWEMAYFTATGRPALARRRHRAEALVPVAGIAVPTYYHGIADLGAALGDDLTLNRVRGIGVLVPPPYLEARWQAVPAALRAAIAGADALVSSWPLLNRCGDHVLARWVRRRDARA